MQIWEGPKLHCSSGFKHKTETTDCYSQRQMYKKNLPRTPHFCFTKNFISVWPLFHHTGETSPPSIHTKFCPAFPLLPFLSWLHFGFWKPRVWLLLSVTTLCHPKVLMCLPLVGQACALSAACPSLDGESLAGLCVPLSSALTPFWCYRNIQLLCIEVKILMRSQENIPGTPGWGITTTGFPFTCEI